MARALSVSRHETLILSQAGEEFEQGDCGWAPVWRQVKCFCRTFDKPG